KDFHIPVASSTPAMADMSKGNVFAYSNERLPDGSGIQHQISTFRSDPWWKFGGRDRIFIPTQEETTKTNPKDDDSTADESVFSNTKAHDIYKPIEKYEGRHRFDLNAIWSDDEERKLVRRVSIIKTHGNEPDRLYSLLARLTDLFVGMYNVLCIAIGSGQYRSGFIRQHAWCVLSHYESRIWDCLLTLVGQDDLGLNTNDYNNGLTIFYCSFLFAELPSQLVSKKIGPDNWIPLVRVILDREYLLTYAMLVKHPDALMEADNNPKVILYLSYFYKNSELPIRLACFWTSYVGTNIIGSFFAYGILHLRGHNGGTAGWRYLFAIEGGITAAVGVISWLYLPPSPTQTKRKGYKGLLRSKEGWFSVREEVIMVTRILRDDPAKATMHNRQAVNWKLLWESLSDYDMWPIYLIGITWTVPFTPETSYLSLTIRSLGFNVFQTNLLIIPSSVLFILQLLFWTWFSEKFNQRFFIGLISQIWVIPLLIALETLPLKFHNAQWARYALTSLIVGYPYAHAMLVAVTSRNSGSVRTRTVGSSLYNMAVQTSNIISSQIYRNDDKPLYRRGNKVLLGIAAWNALLFTSAKAYYVWKNRYVLTKIHSIVRTLTINTWYAAAVTRSGTAGRRIRGLNTSLQLRIRETNGT
ncbi:MAG: hypothetical protein Q9167_007039, partial [Letrouitia subvulpina]